MPFTLTSHDCVQVVPVGEVVPGTFHELRDTGLDLVGVDADRRQVGIAVQHTEVDAVGRWDPVVPTVHLAERRDRGLEEVRVPRRHRRAPVHRVPEPEAVLLVLPALLAEGHRVRVELLPAFDALWALRSRTDSEIVCLSCFFPLRNARRKPMVVFGTFMS